MLKAETVWLPPVVRAVLGVDLCLDFQQVALRARVVACFDLVDDRVKLIEKRLLHVGVLEGTWNNRRKHALQVLNRLDQRSCTLESPDATVLLAAALFTTGPSA